jgi:hypothetical protein
MTLSNGKLTGRITRKEIAECLGESTTKIKGLCLSTNIEKWANCKPLDRAINSELSAAARKQDPRGNKPDVFWGLKAGSVSWANIHNATWDYVDRPTGGIGRSPYRVRDFAGYHHYAEPTMTGSSGQMDDGVAYYNNLYPLECYLAWNDSNNTTGVDILQCVNGSGNLKSWYLCVAIDGYARAMVNFDAGESVRPIYYNNRKCSAFSCPALPDVLQSQKSRKVTFFLADLDNANYDIKTQWRDVTGVSMGKVAVSIPGVVGRNVSFVLLPQTYGKWEGNSIVQFGSNVNVSFTCIEAPSVATTYNVVLQFGNAGSKTKTFSMAAGSTLAPLVQFTDLPVVPTAGQSYQCTARLLTTSGTFITEIKQTITWQ